MRCLPSNSRARDLIERAGIPSEVVQGLSTGNVAEIANMIHDLHELRNYKEAMQEYGMDIDLNS